MGIAQYDLNLLASNPKNIWLDWYPFDYKLSYFGIVAPINHHAFHAFRTVSTAWLNGSSEQLSPAARQSSLKMPECTTLEIFGWASMGTSSACWRRTVRMRRARHCVQKNSALLSGRRCNSFWLLHFVWVWSVRSPYLWPWRTKAVSNVDDRCMTWASAKAIWLGAFHVAASHRSKYFPSSPLDRMVAAMAVVSIRMLIMKSCASWTGNFIIRVVIYWRSQTSRLALGGISVKGGDDSMLLTGLWINSSHLDGYWSV